MSAVSTGPEVVERVLRSRTFAASPSSRRLLRYLAERTPGDPELKEYSVGIDVFGKAPSYDPQRDSTVRIQVGRLRQKLADYYQDEGRDDPVRIEIPKGKFSLSTVESLTIPAPATAENTPPQVPTPSGLPGPYWKPAAIVLGVLALALTAGLLWRPPVKGWNGDLDQIWRPLLASNRPLIIAYGAPLFLELQGTMLFRDRGEENPSRALESDHVQAVRRALGDPPVRPTRYYAAAGEVGGAFSLAKALSPHKPGISLVPDADLSWQHLADNDVIFLGPPRFFRDRLGNLPMELEILPEPDRFRVTHPRPGEPDSFSKAGVQGDGEAFVLITNAAGPGGRGRILSFMSNDTFARQGAVQALTDAEGAGNLIAPLRDRQGNLPAHYQLMLRLKLKGGITTQIQGVLYRALGGPGN